VRVIVLVFKQSGHAMTEERTTDNGSRTEMGIWLIGEGRGKMRTVLHPGLCIILKQRPWAGQANEICPIRCNCTAMIVTRWPDRATYRTCTVCDDWERTVWKI
jgi:hypothetical protein